MKKEIKIKLLSKRINTFLDFNYFLIIKSNYQEKILNNVNYINFFRKQIKNQFQSNMIFMKRSLLNKVFQLMNIKHDIDLTKIKNCNFYILLVKDLFHLYFLFIYFQKNLNFVPIFVINIKEKKEECGLNLTKDIMINPKIILSKFEIFKIFISFTKILNTSSFFISVIKLIKKNKIS